MRTAGSVRQGVEIHPSRPNHRVALADGTRRFSRGPNSRMSNHVTGINLFTLHRTCDAHDLCRESRFESRCEGPQPAVVPS